MSKVIDLTGQRFGRLTVIERYGSNKYGKATWLCQCTCGNQSVVPTGDLRSGRTQSCGCLNKAIDLTGQKFGRLTVIERHGSDKQNKPTWLCLCDCGNSTVVSSHNLKSGGTQSCGCLNKEAVAQRFREHGKKHTRLYVVWSSMKTRCYNPHDKSYSRYGGRGIAIFDEWINDFQAFYEWAMANGYDENAPRGKCTIDRIDNDKGYSPDNCRWVDMKVQNKNRSNTKKK